MSAKDDDTTIKRLCWLVSQIEIQRDVALAENTGTAGTLAAISAWIDDDPVNAARDREAALWGRISKVSEECGEAIAALIGVTGQNPRKGVTHTMGDVTGELLDVALTALAAVEHVTGNSGQSMDMFRAKVAYVASRAGLT